MSPESSRDPIILSDNAGAMTLTILGCGVLGTAILAGVLSKNDTASAGSDNSVPFKKYIACVRRQAAADTIREKLKSHNSASRVSILVENNMRGVEKADAVLLAVQPRMVKSLFAEPGLSQLLAKRLIISVVAGITSAELEAYMGAYIEGCMENRGAIIRVMPNTACVIQKSTTVIERAPNMPRTSIDMTEALFRCVGRTFFAEATEMDVCTTLCGSTPAFLTLILEGLVDGAVSMGVNHVDALRLASETMVSTASMVLSGLEPYRIRYDVASPSGSTIQGVLALEDGGVRAKLANALRHAALAASNLGTDQMIEH